MNIRRRPPNPSVKVANLEYSIPHEEAEPRNILEKIVWEKDREVEIAKQQITIETLKSQIAELPKPKGFAQALSECSLLPAIIAEIKKASPSKGVIREDFDPIAIAKAYKEGGATCLSVLTDKTFFQGGFHVLTDVRKTIEIPILCKDFILTPYQIYQARAAGADAILLIASILSNQDLNYLKKVAFMLDLDVLVEVHDKKELERVLNIGSFPLIGINNRNLKTFQTDVTTTEILSREFDSEIKRQGAMLISESGIFTREDLDRVKEAGAKAALVGEALMREPDIKAGLEHLINS